MFYWKSLINTAARTLTRPLGLIDRNSVLMFADVLPSYTTLDQPSLQSVKCPTLTPNKERSSWCQITRLRDPRRPQSALGRLNFSVTRAATEIFQYWAWATLKYQCWATLSWQELMIGYDMILMIQVKVQIQSQLIILNIFLEIKLVNTSLANLCRW